MAATLLAIPFLTILAILQSALVSRFQLLRGTPDLILLVILAWALQERVKTAWQWGIIAALIVSLFSALPLGTVLVGYLLSIGVALLLNRKVWQVPVFAMFIAIFVGTILTHVCAMIGLRLVGNPISWEEALNFITLPAILLNLLLAIPAYALMGELADWLYPKEIEL
jgi:rod shape-determining protein MreD